MRRVIGCERVTAAQCAAKPEQVWPLVRSHPITRRKSLYLNPKNGLRVVSLDADEEQDAGGADATATNGRAGGGAYDGLVLNLTARALASGTYYHSWAPGDLVLWDNRVLLHAATPFDPTKYERLIFRAEFPGEPVYRY